MTTKEKVIERIQALPDDVDVEEIRKRLDFILGVQEALEASERGQTTPKIAVKGMVRQWASR